MDQAGQVQRAEGVRATVTQCKNGKQISLAEYTQLMIKCPLRKRNLILQPMLALELLTIMHTL